MRYPLADLVTASGLTEAALGRKVGLSGSSLRRAREMGLTEAAADRYATRAGLHPFEVWPEMADHAIEDNRVECAECGRPFMPSRRDQIYCCKECRWRRCNREAFRRRYQTDPAFRQRELQRTLAYQADPRVAAVRRRKARIRYRRHQDSEEAA